MQGRSSTLDVRICVAIDSLEVSAIRTGQQAAMCHPHAGHAHMMFSGTSGTTVVRMRIRSLPLFMLHLTTHRLEEIANETLVPRPTNKVSTTSSRTSGYRAFFARIGEDAC